AGRSRLAPRGVPRALGGIAVACHSRDERRPGPSAVKNLRAVLVVPALVCAPLVASAQPQAPPAPTRPIWRELRLSEARNVLGMRIKNEQCRAVVEIDNLLIYQS